MAIHPLNSNPLSPLESTNKPTEALTEKKSEDLITTQALTSHADTKDTLHLSDESADHEFIQETMKQLPDVRQEKVRKIQKALAAGHYRVSSTDLADRLIQDTILNEIHKQR